MSACDRAILVIDDDADIRETLRDVLEGEGYPVRTAANGEAGLEVLNEEGEPCLILLDLMMPVMSGGEFLDVLRRHEQFAAVPVVVVSAWPQEAAQVGALAQGFVRKPSTLDDILTWAERFCGRPEASPPDA